MGISPVEFADGCMSGRKGCVSHICSSGGAASTVVAERKRFDRSYAIEEVLWRSEFRGMVRMLCNKSRTSRSSSVNS